MKTLMLLAGLAGILYGTGCARGAEPEFILDCQQLLGTTSRGENRELLCRRVSDPPRVDGSLDDPCWQLCEPQTGFLDFGIIDFPNENPDRLIAHQTVVRAAWTPDTLYLGFECLVPSGPLEAENTPDDAVFTNKEAIVAYLDPGGTKQTCYLFAANPLGIRADARCKPGKADYAWNSGWQAKAVKEQNRWTAETAVPIAALAAGRAPHVGAEWGVNFLRHHTAYHVVSIWSNPRAPPWLRLVNLGRDARKADVQLLADGKELVRQPVDIHPGEDRFFPLRARITESGVKHIEAVVKDAGAVHTLTVAAEVLPLMTARLASDLYFTGDPLYVATLALNTEDKKAPAGGILLGVRRKNDTTYLKQGRIANLQGSAARVQLALGDLAPGDYVLESAIVGEQGKQQVASSFPFQMIKTPYDF